MGDENPNSPSKSKSGNGSGLPNALNIASPTKSSPFPNGSYSSPSKPKPPLLQSSPPPLQPKNLPLSALLLPPPTPSSTKGDHSTSPNYTIQLQAFGPKEPPSSSRPPSLNHSPSSGSRTSEKPSSKTKSSPRPRTGFRAPTDSGSFRHSPPSSPGSSNSKLTRPSNTSSSNSTSGGGFESTGKYVGYVLAGVFFVALVAVVLVIALKRKRERTEYFVYMPPDRCPMKPGYYNCGNYQLCYCLVHLIWS